MTNRALIVIDVQREYETGALPVTFPSLDTGLANVGRAMDAAASAGIPIVVIQHDSGPSAPIFADGSESWQLHPVVAQRPHDVVIHKALPGSFTGTGLEAWLREHDIDTVSIAGYMTNVCVDTTSRQAAHLGFRVEVLGDATGTLAYANSAGSFSAEQVHGVTLTVLHAVIGAVVSTDAWIGALDGDALPGDNLISSTRTAATA